MALEARLRVSETFVSVQGESTQAGRLCFFIRLAGCDLRCAYCDTLYARDPASGEEKAVSDLVSAAMAAAVPLVEITGGEPLLQGMTPELCRRLLAAGFEVMVETNGTCPIAALPTETIKIMDIKCPSSGESARFLPNNIESIDAKDEIKFVIADRGDYDFAMTTIGRYGCAKRSLRVLAGLSPAWVKTSQSAHHRRWDHGGDKMI